MRFAVRFEISTVYRADDLSIFSKTRQPEWSLANEEVQTTFKLFCEKAHH